DGAAITEGREDGGAERRLRQRRAGSLRRGPDGRPLPRRLDAATADPHVRHRRVRPRASDQDPMRRPLALALAAPPPLAPAAPAHVTVIPAAARPGTTETLKFRVLNERDNAKTVRIDIFVPGGLKATASDRPGWTRVDKPGEFDWAAKTPSDAIGGASA